MSNFLCNESSTKSETIEIESGELIEGICSFYVPGNQELLTNSLSTNRDTSLIFIGTQTSCKTNLMQSIFAEVSKLCTDDRRSSAVSNLVVLQSLCTIQQSNNFDCYRGIPVISSIFGSDKSFLGAQYAILGLELFRIAKAAPMESDYLIFHDMYAFAPSSIKCKLHLQKLSNTLDTSLADRDRFKSFLESFRSFGTDVSATAEMIASFFSILAAILHLRELQVTETESGSIELGNLEFIAELLGQTTTGLQGSIGVRKIKCSRRASTCETQNSLEQTQKCIEILMKQLYRTAVAWILNAMNRDGAKHERLAQSTLTLVDVPSHENLSGVTEGQSGTAVAAPTNGLSQLCRNFSCDAMHALFLDTLYHREQALLTKEGLGHLWTPVSGVPPSGDLVRLLSQNGGILPLVDVQTKLGEAASDKNYLSQTARLIPTSNGLLSKPRFGEDEGFVVKHYFGAVNYTAAGFVDTNTDNIHKTFATLTAMLQKSSNKVLKDVYAEKCLTKKLAEEEEADLEPHPVQPMKVMDLALEQYRPELLMASRVVMETRLLVSALETSSRVHWVVCSAPNERFPRRSNLDEAYVRAQHAKFSLDKIVTARQKYSFPHRAQLADLGSLSLDAKFLVSVQNRAPRMLGKGAASDCFLDAIMGPDDWYKGAEYVFLKKGALSKISVFADRVRKSAALVLQRFLRDKQSRRAQALFKSVAGVQKLVRRVLAVKAYRALRGRVLPAVVQLQARCRGYVARVKYLRDVASRAEAKEWMGMGMGDKGSSATSLKDNEKIALSGLVSKESSWSILGKQKRLLILTSCSRPRLFYVNADKKEVRGVIDVTDRISVTCADDTLLVVTNDKAKVYKFHVSFGAYRWREALLEAVEEYSACDQDENEGERFRNRSYSSSSLHSSPVKSVQSSEGKNASPVKSVMPQLSTPNKSTPSKSTATFLAVQGSGKRAASLTQSAEKGKTSDFARRSLHFR